jgi:hypothetical protein
MSRAFSSLTCWEVSFDSHFAELRTRGPLSSLSLCVIKISLLEVVSPQNLLTYFITPIRNICHSFSFNIARILLYFFLLWNILQGNSKTSKFIISLQNINFVKCHFKTSLASYLPQLHIYCIVLIWKFLYLYIIFCVFSIICIRSVL